MRRAAGVTCAVAGMLCTPGAAFAVAGDVDTRFGTSGQAVADASGRAAAVAVQPDGKILIAGHGTIIAGGPRSAVVARFNADGSQDEGFGAGGQALLDAGSGGEARDLAVGPDGRIIVAGNIGTDAIVYRLTPDGALDTGFDVDGRVRLDSGGAEIAHAVALQPDGKIVVAGETSKPQVGDAVVYRLTADGSMDLDFDTDGAAGIDSGGIEKLLAVEVRPDGRILAAGSTSSSSTAPDIAIYRLKATGGSGPINGALDTSFDGDGAAGLSGGPGLDEATDIATTPTGRILLAASKGTDAAVFALKPDGGDGGLNGALDPEYGENGISVFEQQGLGSAEALALQPDGKVVVAGYASRPNAVESGGLVFRLLTNGRPDPSFRSGLLEQPGDVELYGVTVQPDGRIVAVGQHSSSTQARRLAAFRMLGDPAALSVTRDGEGTVTSAPAGIDCGAACVTRLDVGTAVTLTATPAPGFLFAGWQGAGCGADPACALTLGGDTTVVARFTPKPPEGDEVRVAPRARIARKPSARIRTKRKRAKVRFVVAADRPGATFECRLDKRPFKTCTAKVKLTVKRGRHRFQVRAVDAAGTGPTVSYRFKVVK